MRYTGIMHAHSTYSYDGKLNLAELKQLFVGRGLSFACMSEHTDELTLERAAAFVAECRTLSDDRFVFVPGFEIPYVPLGRATHMLLLGCEQWPGQTATDAATLQRAATAATLTVLAHPIRNRFKLDETLASTIQGVEIWNQQYDGKRVPRPRSLALLGELRARRPELFATGGLDFHRPEHLGTPTLALELDRLDEQGIRESLQAGRFSFGRPGLEIAAAGDWQPDLSTKLQSYVAIGTIKAGKLVNQTLASFGLSLPSSLRRALRERV